MADDVHVMILNEGLMAPNFGDQLKAALPSLHVEQRSVKRADDLSDIDWGGVEVILTTGLVPSGEQAPDLRWVQAYFAGPDRPLGANRALFEHVKLTTASGVHMPVMGEYALMMMLAHGHHLPLLFQNQAAHGWPANRGELFTVTELRGQTLGILGYGSVGREVGRLAHGFGMRILAAKRNPEQHVDPGWHVPGTGDPSGALPEAYFALDQLDRMLPECDYVLLVLPHTSETRHVINARTLGWFKPTAFLINYGRGSLIDEPALIAALEGRRLGGAALDVFAQQPLPAESPLWALPNVILTPYVSGWTAHYDELVIQLFADNLKRYLAGETLYNEVDVAAGY